MSAVLAPSPVGVWRGAGVAVHRRDGLAGLSGHRRDGVLVVEHSLRPEDLSDELTTMIRAELAEPGLLGGQADFEAVFIGLVRSTVDDALAAWLTFYLNSVARLEDGSADFAPIHRRAVELLAGPQAVDLGSCFGFLPLQMAATGIDVLATDLSAPAMALLRRMALLLGRPVRTLACDAARVPLPAGCADTVTAVHLLEHLPAAAAEAVIDEALRLARRRVVIAVPFEDEATACYGHLRRYRPADLDRMARRVRGRHRGVRASVTEHHGGWLVLDR